MNRAHVDATKDGDRSSRFPIAIQLIRVCTAGNEKTPRRR